METEAALAERRLRCHLDDVLVVHLVCPLEYLDDGLVGVDVDVRPVEAGELARPQAADPSATSPGRVSAGIASVSNAWAWSTVRLLRSFGGRFAGSSTSAAGLVLIVRLRTPCWRGWLR